MYVSLRLCITFDILLWCQGGFTAPENDAGDAGEGEENAICLLASVGLGNLERKNSPHSNAQTPDSFHLQTTRLGSTNPVDIATILIEVASQRGREIIC